MRPPHFSRKLPRMLEIGFKSILLQLLMDVAKKRGVDVEHLDRRPAIKVQFGKIQVADSRLRLVVK